ncbi:MAG: nuclear transport factor 2 family protein [Steroidobacteraceae bacterium]
MTTSAPRPHPGAMLLLLAALAGCALPGSTTTAVNDSAALRTRVALLEARVQRLADINDIKRLQRAYGYYLDEGQWDEAAALFSHDATLEIGKDGVYSGNARIRAYLRALGDGRNGLAPGRLNEHLQVMPVVTLAADGTQAQGTWRDIMLIGQLGKEASWGEGPAEVRYIKEGGIWKIRALHWFQTLYVPYEGGWARNGDSNGARFVGARLTPDAPPTVDYKTWPGAFTPPFHFRGRYPGLEPLPAVTDAAARTADPRRLTAIISAAQRLADQDEIENLQRIYGFYLDKGLWNEVDALFTDDAELAIQGRGTFRGRARILEYLRAVGPEGPAPGRLYDHMQLQPVTHVDADGLSARARWHLFAQLARQGEFHEWATGVYENEYRKEAGTWKIRRLHLYPTMVTPYESGWGKASLPASRFEPDLRPDAAAGAASTYDHAFVTPFHYPNPAKARRAAGGPGAATLPASSLLAGLDAAERQVSAAEDRASIENIQTAYGYYLATLLWDELTELFADDGSIEIALRGVYVGKAAVRRNLNLYGQAGLDDGVLHNHMQFQKVIHVAPDGQTASLRSRALSMMGNFDRNAMWMGGTYENRFVKIGGRWKFKQDQQVNTYFAPYETGWKDLAQRPAPGITAANPPDRPPTFQFDMYPKNFLLPFHYANPVTGK